MNASSTIELEPVEKAAAELAVEQPASVKRKGTYAFPVLEALQAVGTAHVYADSADVEGTGRVITAKSGNVPEGLDGNTANQPLVRKALDSLLEGQDLKAWAKKMSSRQIKLLPRELYPLLYSILCGRVGNDMTRAFEAGRGWEPNLQLHMGLCGRRHRAVRMAHLLSEICPNAIIKVPFTPDHPDCLLLARDLERAGVPVNFTSTFSARQAVTAAVLADVSRTNIFMGRLNQGLDADLVGEHTVLETQRILRDLRSRHGIKTLLIVASIHDRRTFERTAGCDIFTAPEPVLEKILSDDGLRAEAIENRLETSYEDRLGIPEAVLDMAGEDAVPRLWKVEPGLVDFLLEYRNSEEIDRADGEILFKRFQEAGFEDLFHSPDPGERKEMEEGKLPVLDGEMIKKLPLDTHYSLLANADFESHQDAIDAEIGKRLS